MKKIVIVLVVLLLSSVSYALDNSVSISESSNLEINNVVNLSNGAVYNFDESLGIYYYYNSKAKVYCCFDTSFGKNFYVNDLSEIDVDVLNKVRNGESFTLSGLSTVSVENLGEYFESDKNYAFEMSSGTVYNFDEVLGIYYYLNSETKEYNCFDDVSGKTFIVKNLSEVDNEFLIKIRNYENKVSLGGN